MTGGAVVLGELGPRAGLGAVGEQLERGLGGNELADLPGVGVKGHAGMLCRIVRDLAVVVPVFVQERIEPAELERQPRMAGGDQVVVHFHTRSADVAWNTRTD